jgi:prepilin-type processing-associated H-X9-DG protein
MMPTHVNSRPYFIIQGSALLERGGASPRPIVRVPRAIGPETFIHASIFATYGLGEVCSQSNALDIANNGAGSSPGDPLGTHAGMFYRNSMVRFADVTDGTSNTIAVGERSHNLSYVTWVARSINGWLAITSPIEGGTDQFDPSPEECWTQVLGPAGLEDGNRTINDPEAHVEDYGSRHPGGANFLFADGSVHFLKSSINPTPWRALATRNFGEIVSADSFGTAEADQADSPTARPFRLAVRCGLNSALSML